ncbi:MAG: LuxR C-terminal-related transcriptional regulator [Cyanobacteria bacterium P01_A01_bin.40]
MSNVDHALINPTRLLLELQSVDRLNQSLSGCLEPQALAAKITDGLVDHFGCSFARIWLVESDGTALRLVASAGLYTRLNGDFARVPMGAYKVGRIAQHGIPFLSNQLAAESWVKDRQWAIDNQICGFAGLPLVVRGKTIGVLAVFSRHPLAQEFLEALNILCSSVSAAVQNAQLYQQQSQMRSHRQNADLLINIPLSEQISNILSNLRLILVGTERSLNISGTYILLKAAEIFKTHNCSYCRLTYSSKCLDLEAMLVLEANLTAETIFRELVVAISSLDGTLQSNIYDDNIIQIKLSLPYVTKAKPQINLSHREQEVIQLLAAGMRDREIAQKLFISDRTVKFHISNAVHKLQARTRIQAIHQAYSQGYVT